MTDQEQTGPSNNQCSAAGEGASGDVVIEIGHTMAEKNDDQAAGESIDLRRRAVHSSDTTASGSGTSLIFVKRDESPG